MRKNSVCYEYRQEGMVLSLTMSGGSVVDKEDNMKFMNDLSFILFYLGFSSRCEALF